MPEIPRRSEGIDVMIKYALASIHQKLFQNKSLSTILECDQEFLKLLKVVPNHPEVLFLYNEFRIANIGMLPKTRPHILIGGPFDVQYPTTHHYPLFELADVICLTCVDKPLPHISSIRCAPHSLFYDILQRLPKGFEPDFYWDNQIEHWHFIPQGIEIAPFPIVASVCHSFLHKSIEHICELFDFVLPISRSYSDILKKKYPEKIIDLPFGVNWGSFDYLIEPRWNKTIDVCLTFGEIHSPAFPFRNKVVELTKKFKEKYKDRFSIEIVQDISQEKYMELLFNSRIIINVSGVHGPYNYRTIEGMSSGSMLFQLDWNTDVLENHFSELFVDGVHGVSFTLDNFEEKLLYYLENKELTEKIAREGLSYLKENYSYKKLYTELIHKISERKTALPRNSSKHIGFHHVDMAYLNQNDRVAWCMSFGIVHELTELNWISYNNFMIYVCKFQHKNQIHQNLINIIADPLAPSEKTDLWTMCCKFHENALENCPKGLIWLVEWNFLVLSLENGKASKEDIKKIIALLETTTSVTVFEEQKLMFLFSIKSENFPEYREKGRNAVEFISLNLELMKVIDNPIERAKIHHRFALKAARYFLDVISQGVSEFHA